MMKGNRNVRRVAVSAVAFQRGRYVAKFPTLCTRHDEHNVGDATVLAEPGIPSAKPTPELSELFYQEIDQYPQFAGQMLTWWSYDEDADFR